MGDTVVVISGPAHLGLPADGLTQMPAIRSCAIVLAQALGRFLIPDRSRFRITCFTDSTALDRIARSATLACAAGDGADKQPMDAAKAHGGCGMTT